MRDEILDPSNLVKNREILYRLMISQLMYDGLEKFAMELSMLVKADQCAPSERLLHVMIAGMQTLSDKDKTNSDDVLPGIDLEFEPEASALAPEPHSYETAYVTSHKQACRAGAFSCDGSLVATGSVDASIKILDVERMLAKSAPEDIEPGREQQGHPVIRTLYDHTDEVSYLEFHPKEHILASASRDGTVKLFDIAKLLKGAFSHFLGLLLELLNRTLVDAAAFVDQVAGGRRLAGVHMANDHNVNMDLLLAHPCRLSYFLELLGDRRDAGIRMSKVGGFRTRGGSMPMWV